MNELSLKEFHEQGYLQEVNRLFFHPLGLALAVKIDDDGNETLGPIIDNRDDPIGMCFADEVIESDEAAEKASNIDIATIKRRAARIRNLGYFIQPITLDEKIQSIVIPEALIPDDAELVEAYLTKTEIIICGQPEPDDDTHNCDAMGCSSFNHVLHRFSRR